MHTPCKLIRVCADIERNRNKKGCVVPLSPLCRNVCWRITRKFQGDNVEIGPGDAGAAPLFPNECHKRLRSSRAMGSPKELVWQGRFHPIQASTQHLLLMGSQRWFWQRSRWPLRASATDGWHQNCRILGNRRECLGAYAQSRYAWRWRAVRQFP
jgi:hypothetical protein